MVDVFATTEAIFYVSLTIFVDTEFLRVKNSY